MRTILTPPTLAASALAELKDWLAITTTASDSTLTRMLRTALDTCEGFTGRMPLATECEETLPSHREWQALSPRPVQAITALDAIASDGARTALAITDYTIELDADGGARVRIFKALTQNRIAVRFTAGLATSWTSLPEALRQGMILLAADQYRERDEAKPGHVPPAAVTALWRPWRSPRIA